MFVLLNHFNFYRMENLTITLIQSSLTWENALANRQVFAQKIAAISEDTDLVLLPEMFTTGFSMKPKLLAEKTTGSTLEWLQKLSQKRNIALTGSIIVEENKKYYNRLFFVFPDGHYQTYDKRHLFSLAKEEQYYAPGKERIIVTYKGWKICPLICYDLRFPVWARNTQSYDLLLYVANWPKSRIAAWDALLKARSIENLCYTAALNRVGTDPNHNTYNGHSAVYDALGKRISTSQWEIEFTETITLDYTLLQEMRQRFQFLNDRDNFQIL